MKPIIISFTLILLILIGCSVIPYRKPASINPQIGQDRPLLPSSEIDFKPAPLVVADTSTHTDTVPPEPITIIQQLDTAMLRVWFENMHNDPRYRRSIMDDARVQAVLSEFVATLDENEVMVKQLLKAIEEKEKAQEEVQQIWKLILNTPGYMLMVHSLFFLSISLMIYKVHYSRIKLQAYIDGKITKL